MGWKPKATVAQQLEWLDCLERVREEQAETREGVTCDLDYAIRYLKGDLGNALVTERLTASRRD